MKRLLLLPLLLALGCAETTEETLTGPRVDELSKSQLVVGETLHLYGRNFVSDESASVRVIFTGRYRSDDGRDEAVDLSLPAIYDGEVEVDGEALQALRVQRFGPFGNPFSSADRPGRFEGTVQAEFVDQDGLVTRDEKPSEVTLDVGPSVIIDAFEPWDAECGAPALRVLAGVPYQLSVRSVGIKATRFLYEVSRVNDATGVLSFEHDFGRGNPVGGDQLGDEASANEAIIFNPVPAEEMFYVTGLRIFAYDDDGNVAETALPLTVHRPVEVVYGGKRELAERYEPVPVSGCIPGSIGSSVTYSESKTESRQRSVSVTVSQNFARKQGVTNTESYHEGIRQGESNSQTLGGAETEEEVAEEAWGVGYSNSTANNVNASTTDGETWGWDMSEGSDNTNYGERMNRAYGEGSWSGTVGVEGEGSIPGFAKVSGHASTTVGVRAGGSVAGTNGQSQTNSNSRGFNMGGSRSETQSFGSAHTDTESGNLSGSFKLSNSRTSTYSDTTTRDQSRTWGFDQGLSQSEVVSEGQTAAEEATWVESSSDQSVQSFSGRIPRSQVGIFYRQTTRWVRRAEVRAYNLCGLSRHLGELQFNEWTWAPDLALGESCEDRPPPSQLEPATCFVEPCGG